MPSASAHVDTQAVADIVMATVAPQLDAIQQQLKSQLTQQDLLAMLGELKATMNTPSVPGPPLQGAYYLIANYTS